MRTTKKITLSAMLVALGTVFMVIGSVFEVLDLTVSALSSLIVVFVYLELGSYYPWLVWICTSLSTAILYSGSVIWVEYFLVFGIFPLIKAYIERLPRWTWFPIKLAYINAIVFVLYLICEHLLGVPFFEEEGGFMRVALIALINVAFIAYDMFISVMVRLYFAKFRARIKGLLK